LRPTFLIPGFRDIGDREQPALIGWIPVKEPGLVEGILRDMPCPGVTGMFRQPVNPALRTRFARGIWWWCG